MKCYKESTLMKEESAKNPRKSGSGRSKMKKVKRKKEKKRKYKKSTEERRVYQFDWLNVV